MESVRHRQPLKAAPSCLSDPIDRSVLLACPPARQSELCLNWVSLFGPSEVLLASAAAPWVGFTLSTSTASDGFPQARYLAGPPASWTLELPVIHHWHAPSRTASRMPSSVWQLHTQRYRHTPPRIRLFRAFGADFEVTVDPFEPVPSSARSEAGATERRKACLAFKWVCHA